jgi:hypothetical protein
VPLILAGLARLLKYGGLLGEILEAAGGIEPPYGALQAPA